MKKQLLITFVLLLLITSTASASLENTVSLSLDIINQNPDPAVAGNIVELRIGITNNGGETADDVVVEFLPSYPFTLVPGESAIKNINTIGAYQGVDEDSIYVIKYKLRVAEDAPEDTYDADFYVYEKGSSSKLQTKVLVDVENSQSAEVIYIDQVELIPGKVTPLKFTINNVGAAPLRDLTFHWENEDDIILPVGSDNTKYVDIIPVGESAELTFDVIASTASDPDLYKLDLTLTYEDSLTGDEKTVETKAGVYVGGSTDFDVAYSGTSGQETSFSVANIGSVSATSVTIKIPDQQGWRVSGSNSVIIGNLNKGDYTIASFSLSSLQNSAPQAISGGEEPSAEDMQRFRAQRNEDSMISVEVVYTDSRGNRNSVTKEVSIDSTSLSGTGGDLVSGMPSGFGNGNFPGGQPQKSFFEKYWVLILIVVVVAIVYNGRIVYIKRKRENPKYTLKMFLKKPFGKK